MKTRTFLLLLSAILPVSLYAQPSIVRQKAYGAPEGCAFMDMKITYDHGLIMGGYSGSVKGIDKTESSKGANDYWVIKLDSAGHTQWDKTLGGNKPDQLTTISPTKDHGFIIGGYSLSGISGDKTGDGFGDYDYWIIKLDGAGNKEWDKTFGGDGYDLLSSIDTTSDGGYIVGGNSTSGISGNKTTGSFGQEDYWIIKLDATGNTVWEKTIGAAGEDLLTKVKQTKDGGYILGGTSWSGISGNKTELSRGFNDYWIVKLDNAGNIQWDKTLGADKGEQLSSIIQTWDGGYIAGGTSYSGIAGDKTGVKGLSDEWLVKLDSNGKVVYDKALGGNLDNSLRSIQQTKDSGLIIGGSSSSGISGDKTEQSIGSGTSDYWIVKLNKRGSVLWDKTMGGTAPDGCSAICEYQKNTFIAGGMSYSKISGNRTVPLKGGGDWWIVLLNYQKPALRSVVADALRTDKMGSLFTSSFTVYPNPANNIIHIQSAGKSSFSLISQSGKIVLTKTITGNGQMNVAHLPAGVYYLQNITNGTREKILIK